MQKDCLLTCTVSLALMSAPAIAEETLYTNGEIYTLNESQPWAEATADATIQNFIDRSKSVDPTTQIQLNSQTLFQSAAYQNTKMLRPLHSNTNIKNKP